MNYVIEFIDTLFYVMFGFMVAMMYIAMPLYHFVLVRDLKVENVTPEEKDINDQMDYAHIMEAKAGVTVGVTHDYRAIMNYKIQDLLEHVNKNRKEDGKKLYHTRNTLDMYSLGETFGYHTFRLSHMAVEEYKELTQKDKVENFEFAEEVFKENFGHRPNPLYVRDVDKFSAILAGITAQRKKTNKEIASYNREDLKKKENA